MKSIATCTCVVLLLLAGVAVGEEQESYPQTLNEGCSGMVLLAETGDTAEYLVVHDRKDMDPHIDFAWLGIVTWTKKQGTTWKRLWLDVPEGVRAPNDLEAVCAVPGTTDLFLAAESSYYKTRYGRVILLRVQKAGDAWQVRWERSFRPHAMQENTTPKHKHIEGMACIATGSDRMALLLATVGEKGFTSLLHWGVLDLKAEKEEDVYDERGCAILTAPSGPLCARSCGALQIRPAQPDGDLPVWSAAAIDPGDAGPFRSQVFEAGRLRRIRGHTIFRYCRYRCPLLVGNVEHVKMEALAQAPSWALLALLVYGTDDEDFGAVYRPLFARR